MSNKFVITWEMMHGYCRQLAEKQMPAEQWKGILAVSRGGLVPAAILARELGIRYVDTVCIFELRPRSPTRYERVESARA